MPADDFEGMVDGEAIDVPFDSLKERPISGPDGDML